MNASRQISLLKQIDTKLTDVDNALTNNISSYPFQNGLTLANIYSDTTAIKNDIDTIQSDISAIKTDVDTLAKKKIIFNARLTDGTNLYLPRADYSGGSAIDFYWQNDKGTPVYILDYRFMYADDNEPASTDLYGATTTWDSKIGAMNSAGDDYEAPYVTMSDNRDYIQTGNPNQRKIQWISNVTFVFENDFRDVPIEIGISRKFGHHIAGNINTSMFDSDPVGIIRGYYYSS